MSEACLPAGRPSLMKRLQMKKILFLFLLLFLLMDGFSQSLVKVADSVRRMRNIPGIVYAVFSTDSIYDIGAAGIKRIRTRSPVTVRNRFMVGSNTTTFTTYIAQKLVDAKKISWNTSLISVLPELNGKTMKLYHKLTLQHFLSGRAGIRPFTELKDYQASNLNALQGNPRQQRLFFTTQILKEKPTLIEDSSKGVYSVASVCVATSMLEKASGKSWEDLVQLYINKPLKMHVEFGFPIKKDSTEPSGHWDTYGGITAEPENYWAYSFPVLVPSQGINITISDYIRFIREYLLALQQKKSTLSQKTANHMLFGLPNYALGWSNIVWKENYIANWIGRGAVFSSYVEIVADKNLAIVVLCNIGTTDGRAGSMNLGRILREHYVK